MKNSATLLFLIGFSSFFNLTGSLLEYFAAEPKIGIVISISDRELYVYEDGSKIETYSIAVGSEEYPTSEGNFEIFEIVWNPDWIPPDSDWAKEEEYKPPGHPENPMGRVKIIYDPPFTIHGTDDLESLGKAESHGSIRLSNENAIELAKKIMEATGDSKTDDWYEKVLDNPTSMETVELSEKMPLTIKP